MFPEMAEHRKTAEHKMHKELSQAAKRRKGLWNSPAAALGTQSQTPRAPVERQPAFSFTYEDLYNCLYRHHNVQLINVDCNKKPQTTKPPDAQRAQLKEGSAPSQCETCRHKSQAECPRHGRSSFQNKASADHKELWITYAITSFPNEVQLCTSSIPGEGWGVCAKQHIPLGTWIGPYEGRRVLPEDVTPNMNTSYMWEIFQENRLVYYIDAADENTSSWMRFIRCARFREEQNLFAFQYCGNIYYRAFRDIPVGAELLVWYDEKYPLFMGLPMNVQDMAIIDPSGSKILHDVLTAQAAQQGQLTTTTHAPTSGPLPIPIPIPTPVAPPRARVRPPPANQTHPSQPPDQSGRGTRDGHPEVNHVVPRKRIKTLPDSSSAPVVPEVPIFRGEGPTNLKVEKDSRDGKSDDDRHLSEFPDEPDMGLWKCGQCSRSFPQRSLLQIHICPRMSDRPYKCGHCSDSFAHSSELRSHVVAHTNEKPFKCGYCSRSFAGATTLNNHIRTHTGERPFTCDKCNRTFGQATQLSRHMRTPEECLAFRSENF